jgi:hypothetical protein
MKHFNLEQNEWCRERFEKGWRFGNIRGTDLHPEFLFKHVPRAIDEHVRRLCPTLCTYFDERSASPMSALRQYNAAMWNDIVMRRWRMARRRVEGVVRSRLARSQDAPAQAGR